MSQVHDQFGFPDMASENNGPRVSVCVITYNQEEYIRRCLQSIVEQETDFDFEIIVGEDCSSDGTRAIVMEFQAKYPGLFKLILHQSNVGCFENFRQVHFTASATFIAHLDGDDYWSPNKLQSQLDFMDDNRFCPAVYSNARVENDSGEIIGVFSRGVNTFFDLSYLIQKGNFLTNSSLMYRAEYREKIIPAYGEFVDFLLHIRLAQEGELGFIDRQLVCYTHQSTTSMIQSGSDKVRLLIWDALNDIKLSNKKNRIVEDAKIYFLADAIFFEAVHGKCKRVFFWTSLLSNITSTHIFMLWLRLYVTGVIYLFDKFRYYLSRYIDNNSNIRAIYKR